MTVNELHEFKLIGHLRINETCYLRKNVSFPRIYFVNTYSIRYLLLTITRSLHSNLVLPQLFFSSVTNFKSGHNYLRNTFNSSDISSFQEKKKKLHLSRKRTTHMNSKLFTVCKAKERLPKST